MRYIRYGFLAALGLALLVVATANRADVTLNLLPEELSRLLGWSVSIPVPLFLVIFGGIVAGILIGFVWEWLREHKYRAEASAQRRERDRLEREMERLRGPERTEDDDVLALLEDGRVSR